MFLSNPYSQTEKWLPTQPPCAVFSSTCKEWESSTKKNMTLGEHFRVFWIRRCKPHQFPDGPDLLGLLLTRLRWTAQGMAAEAPRVVLKKAGAGGFNRPKTMAVLHESCDPSYGVC